jgi:glucose/arabinose dehydrogenase/mono/diheme cytochrome c family protein
MKKLILPFIFLRVVVFLISCKNGNSPDKNFIPADSPTIAKGESLFNQNCGSCHNFKQDGIGPQLSSITKEVSPDWLQQFIHDPQKTIESGDQRAKKLFEKYHTIMPSFPSMQNEEVTAIIAFLNIHKEKPKDESSDDSTALTNPISKPIELSNLTINIELVTQFPASSDKGKLPLTRITKMAYQPNKTGPFILDIRGKLYKLVDNHPVDYMDMARLKPKLINEPGLGTGFGSFAFHPGFSNNGLLYTTHTEPAGTAKADFPTGDTLKKGLQWVLTEWKTDQPAAMPFSGTARELLRIDFTTDMHGVQEITFNPLSKPGDKDYGLLYVGVGDGGCVENGYPQLAHNRSKIWGTVLRIDPAGSNSENGNYGIPASNPFVKNNSANELKEIYALGFRNPHRITWTQSGEMFVTNIGQGNIESVNIVKAGNDFGWPVREGNFALNPSRNLNKAHPLPADDSIYHFTYPVIEYDHDEGKAISGGYEYTGSSIAALKGKFIFGDIPSGRLFYSNMADIKPGKQAEVKEWKVAINGVTKSLTELCGPGRVDLHFGRDDRGEIYILTKADGKLYRLTSATLK